MKVNSSVLVVTLLSSMLVNTTALASKQTKCHGSHLSRFINKFDSNDDKEVTKEEFSVSMKQRFKQMDIDNNGVVSQEEFKSKTNSRHREYEGEMDADKDGLISEQEFLDAKLKKAKKKFSKLDIDNNGFLNTEEKSAHKRRFKKRGNYFPKIDQNSDGVISFVESQNSSENLFKKLDTNKDQVITQDEIQAMKQTNHKKD